jgi:hypothetical protein
MKYTVKSFLASVLSGLASVLLVLWFVSNNAPQLFILSKDPVLNYPSAPMQGALTPDAVRTEQDRILALGNRFIGTKGYFAMQDYVREVYEQNGLEIYELHNDIVAPVTETRQLSIVDPDTGQVRESFDDLVYPFLPNHMQPMVTPENGLTGELMLIDKEAIQNMPSFEGKIGLVDLSDKWIGEHLTYDWTRYAGIGLSALILFHPQGWEAVKTVQLSGPLDMISPYPVNYVRLMAASDILSHVGKTIRLDVKTAFKEVSEKTYVGIMRAPEPAREAVIFHGAYDTGSDLPDRSRGGVNALNYSILVQFLRGLHTYKESLTRDVILLSHGSRGLSGESLTQLLRFLGPNTRITEKTDEKPTKELQANRRKLIFLDRIEENDLRHKQVASILPLFNNARFLIDRDATEAAFDSIDIASRTFLTEQIAHTLKTVVSDRLEPYIQARVRVEADNITDPDHPYLKAYRETRVSFEEARSASGYSPSNLLKSKSEFAAEIGLLGRTRKRFLDLQSFHQRNNAWIAQGFALIELFSGYQKIGFFETFVGPAHPETDNPESITFTTGQEFLSSGAYGIASLLSSSRERLGLADAIKIPKVTPIQNRTANRETATRPAFTTQRLSRFGYPSYRFVSFGRRWSYIDMYNPSILPYMKDANSLEATLSVLGETFLSLAHGNGSLEPWSVHPNSGFTFGGTVIASNMGTSVVPDFAVEGALVGGPPESWGSVGRGLIHLPFVTTDPYGRFWRPRDTGSFPNFQNIWKNRGRVSLMAAKVGDDGLIKFIKDDGAEAQRLFQSVGINLRDEKALANTTIALFRASPVTIFDVTNPQTLQDFRSIKLVSAEGLIPFNKQFVLGRKNIGMNMYFIEPDKRFAVLLQAGTLENEQVVQTRAFMLGFDDPWQAIDEQDLVGPGYLVKDHPFLIFPADQIARSMLAVNTQRLEIQKKYDMVDALTDEYHEKAVAYFKEEQNASKALRDRESELNETVTYSMLIHPVLRNAIWEAILGILWYLGLLVPFVYFLEKMLFCHTNVNRQILAQTTIFLCVFLLLRLLHPALAMVRSSLMILLGFIIILISAGMTVLFSSKFNQNLEQLRQRRGKLTSVEGNKLGIMITSFHLGLNNMHRRKVRTGLTCATLTLLTFAMISFTSIQSDLIDESVATGRAPYQGILLKKESFQNLSAAEIGAVRQKYGDRFEVVLRRAFVGRMNWPEGEPVKPGIEISFSNEDISRKLELDSVLDFDHKDPIQRYLRFTTKPYWFPESYSSDDEDAVPVILPDRLAERLGITRGLVKTGNAIVEINSTRFKVRAIVEAESLANYRDLDGADILPFDMPSVESFTRQRGATSLIPDDSPRVDPGRIVLLPENQVLFTVPDGRRTTLSIAVVMDNVGYQTARGAIQTHIEQTGETVHYGLDGIAYQGRRTRDRSHAGMIEMIIPLIIAALAVLNTMKSSVYERKGEIYVYNSIGIAPRYIFLMFMAEAFVYAVVGAVVGYLLSQTCGWILSEFNFTGGLSMTYASLSTIYASLAIMGAVFLSTLYPATQAMRIAAPAEESGWKLPEPQDDEIAFDLPFNFRNRGRLAILEFVFRLLEDHGEGGGGRYFANPPNLAIRNAAPGVACPELRCRIWLKPFDLGASQDLIISILPDSDTGLYKATIRIHRVSGTREAWVRLNHGFVVQLRRHFLHWRVVDEEAREEMFQAARQKLLATLPESLRPANQTASL